MIGSKTINTLTALLLILVSFSEVGVGQKDTRAPGNPVLWRDPGDVAGRDLRHGPGSEALAPQAPFTFVEQVKGGASPKFSVTDTRGVTWVVKLGEESQSETVASRLIWAVGYFAEEAYFFERVDILKLPRLSRGSEHVTGTGTIKGARFEPRRPDVIRGENWEWRENPFVGTRELDGLKVMMVLLANYDTSPANNRILIRKDPETGDLEHHYVVSDLGATLGRVGGLGGKRTKNTLEDFREGKFVVEVQDGVVEFDYRTRPTGVGIFASIFNPMYRKSQSSKEKAMRRIPLENARWIGTLLASLSDDQLRDAFRAAAYDDQTAEGFTKVLRSRIAQLTTLDRSAIQE